ncbi:MAG: hypothetical protein JWN13_3471 [Betaproteobacteria bacterium]|nr:hypothetical protein [Betaproteobacteria bacterium]
MFPTWDFSSHCGRETFGDARFVIGQNKRPAVHANCRPLLLGQYATMQSHTGAFNPTHQQARRLGDMR